MAEPGQQGVEDARAHGVRLKVEQSHGPHGVNQKKAGCGGAAEKAAASARTASRRRSAAVVCDEAGMGETLAAAAWTIIR